MLPAPSEANNEITEKWKLSVGLSPFPLCFIQDCPFVSFEFEPKSVGKMTSFSYLALSYLVKCIERTVMM